MTTTDTRPQDDVGSQLIDAAIRILAVDGAHALNVRKVAAEAGVSTMAVYSRFGDKTKLLNSVYLDGFKRLGERMAGVDDGDPVEKIRSYAHAYRGFAIANPALYSLLFEQLVGFDPPAQDRAKALGQTFQLLIESLENAGYPANSGPAPRDGAYLLWSAVHGAVSLELLHTVRSPYPGWFTDNPESSIDVFNRCVETTLRGMNVIP